MDYVDIQAVESKLTDVTVTPIPMIKNAHTNHSTGGGSSSSNYGANHTANITITPQVNHRNSHNNSNHHHHSSVSGAVNDGSSGALALTVGSNHSNNNNNNANSSSSSSSSNNNNNSNNSSAANLVAPVTTFNQFPNNAGLSKYAQLLMVIEEMGRDLRPTYSGSRNSAERLKRLIVHARILVRECLVETERSARQ